MGLVSLGHIQPGAVESTTRMYICVLYVSSQVDGERGEGGQKQQASHNNRASH